MLHSSTQEGLGDLWGPAAGLHVLLCFLRVGECVRLWHDLHPGCCHEGASGGHCGPKASGDQCLFNKGLQTHPAWAWACWEPSCATLESRGPGIRALPAPAWPWPDEAGPPWPEPLASQGDQSKNYTGSDWTPWWHSWGEGATCIPWWCWVLGWSVGGGSRGKDTLEVWGSAEVWESYSI